MDTTRQIEIAAGAGYSLLMTLDHLGARVLSFREHRRIIAAKKRRIPWTSWAVIGGVSSLVAVLGVGVVSNISGENAWLTAGPAGAASAAAVPIAASTSALSTSTVTPHNAQSSATRKESPNMSTKSTAAKTIATGLTGALAVAGGTAALAAPASAARVPAAKHVVHKTLVIQSSGRKGWPEFVNSKDIVLPKNSTVVLTIDSHDDGSAPLPKNVVFYDKVMGTVGGKETAGGKTLSGVKNTVISHTFTIPQLGINLPIPAAPTGKVIVVQATIHTGKAGTYTWQCYAPCGTGKNSEHGPMDASGYMKGTVTIK